MNALSFLRLLQNAALLLSLVLVFDVFALHWRAGEDAFSRYRLVAGLSVSAIGVVVMLTPWVLLPGLVFDTRSVLLSISGLFFGTAPTLIAVVITAALRLYEGGPGVWPGVSTILVTASLGLIWRRVRRRKLDEITVPELYLFGLVNHVVMLGLMFTLPLDMALYTLRSVSAPVLIIYPLASTLLGGLMVNRLKREKIIDERRHVEEALLAERQLLRTLIDNLPDAIYAKDAQGRKTLSNRTDLDNIGLPEEEALGKTDAEMFPPEIAARFMADDQVVLSEGTPVIDREELLTNRDGKTFWQLTSKVPLHDADGKIVGLVGIGRDITERKKAEAALRAERDLVSRVMETSPAGIVMVNREGQIEFANRQAEQVLGLSRDQMHERTYNDPEWRHMDYEGNPFPDDAQPFSRVQQTLHPVNDVRQAIEWPDGRRVLLRINAAPMLDESGIFNGMIATVEDVTAQVQAQEMLRMTQFAVEQAAIEVFWINKDGHFIYVNKRACEALGYSPEQLLTLGVTDIDPDFSSEHWQSHWQEIQQRKTFTLESRHRTREGHIYPVEITVNYLEYNGKGYNFAFGVDITERNQAEKALRESEERFRQASISMMDIAYSCVHQPDAGYTIDWVTGAAEATLGYSPEELQTLGCWGHLVLDEDWHLFEKHIIGLHPGEAGECELRLHTKSGEIIWTAAYARCLRMPDPSGHLRLFGALVNITERKEVESQKAAILEALRESEQKYRTLFEQITEGFALHEIITDEKDTPCDYRFLEINPAYEQLTGLTRERCLGQTLLQVLPDIDRHWIADFGQVALTGKPAYIEDYVPELERYYEVWAYSPRPRQFAALVKDVTERRQQEIERAALLEAEHEQRLRAETLRDVTLALTSALSISDVLMEILQQAQRLVPSSASNIALLEDEALHIVGWRGYAEYGTEQDIAGMVEPLSDFSISAELIASGEPYITADTHDEPRWQRLPATAWLCAHISLPISLGEKVLGVLRLDSDQVGTFSIQDVERLRPLARAAAIALENAQLYTQVQRELEEQTRSQAALEASERKFREMLENMRLFAVMLDLEGRVTFCNDFGLQLAGLERDAVLGCDWFETFIPPELRDEMRATFLQNFNTGNFPPHFENEVLTAGGTARALIAWNNMVVRDSDNNVTGVSSIGEDITARRQAESALKASEAWLRSLVDSMDDVVFSLDTEQRHTALYGQWVERIGMSPEYFLGRTARDVFGLEAARVHETANIRVLTTGASVTYEWGTPSSHFQTTLSPLRGPEGEIVGLVGVGRDITALKDYQMQLQTALDEKTLMLSEIHHRIKNNLQVILGLLDLQFSTTEDEDTQQMLRESQNRIKAIALIHERLYQTPGESRVDARLYFHSLVRYLTATYDAMVRGIVVEQSIDDLELDIDLAIPCALIVNELISNALKYAFPPGWQPPDGVSPTLRVALHRTDGHVQLTVADNGVGLPESLDLEASARLGLRLIRMLARQIDGELSIEQNEGTCIAIAFTWSEEK